VLFVLDAVGGNGVTKSLLDSLQFFCIAPFLCVLGYGGLLAWRQYLDAKPKRPSPVIVVPYDRSEGQSYDGIDAAESLMDSWRGR
jgi:hypothetical protein